MSRGQTEGTPGDFVPAGADGARRGVWLVAGGLALCSLVAFVLLLRAYWTYTIDDAFISFRYAANWSHGLGVVYNAGERVEGYTNFLWVAVLALLMRLGCEPVLTAKALGVAFMPAGMVCAGALLGPRYRSPLPLALMLTGLMTSSAFVVNTVEGLETPLFAALTLGALACFAREARSPGRFPFSAALAALAYLTRPDGALLGLVLLAVGGGLGLGRGERTGPWRRWFWPALAILLVVIGAHLAWRHAYYGSWLPNTFYAKGGGSRHQLFLGLRYLTNFSPIVGGLLIWPVALFGLVRARWPGAVAAAVGLHLLTRTGFALWSGGEWMGLYRFMAPLMPLLYLLVGLAAVEALSRPASPTASRRVSAGIVILALVFVYGNWWRNRLDYPQCLDYAHGLQAAHIALGQELRAIAGPTDWLACSDAGALPFYSGLRTIDILGLNDRHVGRLPGVFYGKQDAAYVLGRRPTWVVLVSRDGPPGSVRGRTLADQAIADSPAFRRNYLFRQARRMADDYYLWLYQRRE